MFENVDGRTNDGVTGILIAHLGAFGSGELKKETKIDRHKVFVSKEFFSKDNHKPTPSAHHKTITITITKKEGKDQESIQSSTTPDPGHKQGKVTKHKKTSHTRQPKD